MGDRIEEEIDAKIDGREAIDVEKEAEEIANNPSLVFHPFHLYNKYAHEFKKNIKVGWIGTGLMGKYMDNIS